MVDHAGPRIQLRRTKHVCWCRAVESGLPGRLDQDDGRPIDASGVRVAR
jgi:hypothetical protein